MLCNVNLLILLVETNMHDMCFTTYFWLMFWVRVFKGEYYVTEAKTADYFLPNKLQRCSPESCLQVFPFKLLDEATSFYC